MSENPTDVRSYRLSSIDALRGLAIVFMALDHVRDFFLISAEPNPLANPNISIGLFVTRWITHFCAPVFVILAGVSVGLMRQRKNKVQLSIFLFTRGMWLIAVEWFIISNAWTFSPLGLAQLNGKIFVMLQVIWAIGASMVALSAFQLFGRKICFVIGLLILFCHNLLDSVWPQSEVTELIWPLWVGLHSRMAFNLGPFIVYVVYPLLPWIGVMLLGFGLSSIFELPSSSRKAVLLRSGLIITFLFILLRLVDIYGDPNGWMSQSSGIIPTSIDFLNTTKYPPSLLFLLMTLGPTAIVCSLIEKLPNILIQPLIILGRVPFTFYVAHLYLIHLLSVLLAIIQGFSPICFMTYIIFYPESYGLSLVGVYMIWLLVLIVLFPLCQYVASVKSRRKDWWLSYI